MAERAVAVLTRGEIDDGEVDYALKRVETVLSRVEEPVLLLRLKLHRAPDPARELPAIAEVSVDMNGDVVRAHVAGHDMREAADLLQRRLSDKIDHRSEHFEWKRRHATVPMTASVPLDRIDDEARRVVRHKTFAVDSSTAEEASFDMEQLDYDFFLFRDDATGEDTVLVRGGGVLSMDGAPVLDVDAAAGWLDVTGERFVLFADSDTGRGNVMYRRDDGDYGLITPA